MPHPRILKHRDPDRRYRFQVSSSNGSILLRSKAYKTSDQRDRGVQILQEHYADIKNYESDITEFGHSVFHFKYSRYGRIGTSIYTI